MLIFSISFPDLIKFHYFVDTPERRVWGWKEAQRLGDFTNNFSIYIYTHTPQNIYMGPRKCIWQIFTLASCKCKKNIYTLEQDKCKCKKFHKVMKFH